MNLQPIAILHRRRINRNPELSLNTIAQMKGHGLPVTVLSLVHRLRLIQEGAVLPPPPRNITVTHLN